MFIFAQIENIGMNLGIFPIIRLPLPFVSYGGTNIIVYFMFLGILANIEKWYSCKYRKMVLEIILIIGYT